MVDPKVTVYGAYWCPDCRRSKKFLGEQFIPFRWVDIEQDMAGEAYVLEKNSGKRIIPLIEFPDGSFLVEPTNAERVLNGYKLKPKRKIDWQEQFKRATEAFERNGFFVLVGDKQAETLDQEFEVKVNTEVSFVRLMPLVGG